MSRADIARGKGIRIVVEEESSTYLKKFQCKSFGFHSYKRTHIIRFLSTHHNWNDWKITLILYNKTLI